MQNRRVKIIKNRPSTPSASNVNSQNQTQQPAKQSKPSSKSTDNLNQKPKKYKQFQPKSTQNVSGFIEMDFDILKIAVDPETSKLYEFEFLSDQLRKHCSQYLKNSNHFYTTKQKIPAKDFYILFSVMISR
jgi:hypothetical protein